MRARRTARSCPRCARALEARTLPPSTICDPPNHRLLCEMTLNTPMTADLGGEAPDSLARSMGRRGRSWLRVGRRCALIATVGFCFDVLTPGAALVILSLSHTVQADPSPLIHACTSDEPSFLDFFLPPRSSCPQQPRPPRPARNPAEALGLVPHQADPSR